MRICKKCGIEKPKQEFYRAKENRDGLSSWCKSCHLQYHHSRWITGENKILDKKSKEKTKELFGSMYFRYKEQSKARIKKYEKTDKGKLARKICKKNRQHKELEKLHADQIDRLLKFYSSDGKCLSCGCVSKLEIDHVIPISIGGTNTIDNIQPLCRSCNAKKHTQCVDYRYDLGRYARSLS